MHLAARYAAQRQPHAAATALSKAKTEHEAQLWLKIANCAVLWTQRARQFESGRVQKTNYTIRCVAASCYKSQRQGLEAAR